MSRPIFEDIKDYDEFRQYYWYREELQALCKQLGIDSRGNKAELNHRIEEYYKGNIIVQKIEKPKKKKTTDVLTLDTSLLACGFCFNQKFRDFFSKQTGILNFKFNTDMVATAKAVKESNDERFTLQDMLDIYYGKKEYAHYDTSSCQWNQFLKDFCSDIRSSMFTNKLKVAAILWKIVRGSTADKVYTKTLIDEHYEQVKDYIISG